MVQVVIDAALFERLTAATELVQLVDGAGRVAGVFAPAPASTGAPAEADVEPFTPGAYAPFTDEEVRGVLGPMAQADGGITMAELLTKLRKL